MIIRESRIVENMSAMCELSFDSQVALFIAKYIDDQIR